MAQDVKRLIEQFVPENYALSLTPDAKTLAFEGEVTISGFKRGRPSQRITLHQKGLKVHSATIHSVSKQGDRSVQQLARINLHKKFDEVRLHTKQKLYLGKYEIVLSFSGKITDEMHGLYPSRFKQSGKEMIALGTQFESHHAREVFPCIDEPEAKATFDLTLTAPQSETVVSNTPIKKQISRNKYQETTFETTPKMSTYLLAFVIGELDFKEAKTKRGVTVRAYAIKANVKFTEFALDTAVKCLDFYEDYFGIDYPLAKCDFVALPDFASGAMENWGCITFREQNFLVDEQNTSLPVKQYTAMVVAHELAHMWFGNLVTMRWWTDLWLNEGFASWIEYLAVDDIYPEWKLWTQFIVDEQQQAFKLDALENTHPVEVPIKHPDEIRSIFDAISYSKGSSIIHMLHGYLGKDVFREGLSLYLKKHSYGNTETVDLWKSLEDASGKPVSKFMHKWTSTPGFPLVKATVEDNILTLEQQRFFVNPNKRDSNQTWPVPLLATEKLGAEVLEQKSLRKTKLREPANFRLNNNQSGFYRTIYNATHLQRLGEAIQKGKLSELQRVCILSDLFEAAKAGHIDTLSALRFLTNFENEDSYAVWDIISSCVGSIRLVMDNEELREQMKPYILKLTQKQRDRLSWERKAKDSHFDRLLRPIVFNLAANADDAEIIKRCKALFKKAHQASDIKPELREVSTLTKVKRAPHIDPDMRGIVFGTVARLGGKTEFDKLLKMHTASISSEERNTLAAAITNFKQPDFIKQALAQITTKEVRLQDVAYWIAFSFMNRWAKRETWKWLQGHWKWLEEKMGADMSFSRMPIYAARVFSDPKFKSEYQKFFEPKLTPALERGYKQGLEILEWQISWKTRALAEIKHFFKNE